MSFKIGDKVKIKNNESDTVFTVTDVKQVFSYISRKDIDVYHLDGKKIDWYLADLEAI